MGQQVCHYQVCQRYRFAGNRQRLYRERRFALLLLCRHDRRRDLGVHRGRSVPRSGGHRLFGHSRLRTGVGQGDAPRAGQDRRSGRQRLHRSGQFRRRRPRRPAHHRQPVAALPLRRESLSPLERHRIVGLPARRRRAGLVSGFRCGHVLGKIRPAVLRAHTEHP